MLYTYILISLLQLFTAGQKFPQLRCHLSEKKKQPREISWRWTEQPYQQVWSLPTISMSSEQHMMSVKKHRVKTKTEQEHVEYLPAWFLESQPG